MPEEVQPLVIRSRGCASIQRRAGSWSLKRGKRELAPVTTRSTELSSLSHTALLLALPTRRLTFTAVKLDSLRHRSGLLLAARCRTALAAIHSPLCYRLKNDSTQPTVCYLHPPASYRNPYTDHDAAHSEGEARTASPS